jgi:hypothetical protein
MARTDCSPCHLPVHCNVCCRNYEAAFIAMFSPPVYLQLTSGATATAIYRNPHSEFGAGYRHMLISLCPMA